MSEIYNVVSLDTIAKSIDPSQDLAFDTETVGKYGRIRLAQFYQRHWPKALMVDSPSIFELFQLLVSLKDTNIVMQYCSYDISTVQKQTGSRWVPQTFNDTFLLARLALPQLSKYSLDELINYAIGHDPYAAANIVKADMHKLNWGKLILEPKELLYAALDVYYLFDLYDKVKIAEDTLSYKVDMRALRRALDFQNNGFCVDQDRIELQYASNLARIKEIALPINANSWKQVRPYIGSENSDDLGLAKLSMNGNDKAAAVRETRKLLKQNSFLDKFSTDDGRIYGHFAPSARSGRFTCSNQNLQQLPRATKGCFGVPEGRVLLYSDYAQLELRTVAAITGDRTLCQLFYDNADPHNHVAKFVFGENFTKDHRQTTKTINFNALYGGGAGMLQGILLKQANQWLEIDEIKAIMRKWRRIFPGIVGWQEKGIGDYNKGRLGSTPFGRQYRGNLMTDQLNIANQGFGADIAKLALHYMYDDLLANDAQLVNFIHDSYIIEMPDDEIAYKKVAKLAAEAMKEAWIEGSKMAKVTDIPMPVEIGVGSNWGDLEAGNTIYSLTV